MDPAKERGSGTRNINGLVHAARIGDRTAIDGVLREFTPLPQSYLKRHVGERLARAPSGTLTRLRP